jgi:hypothetical protein
LRPVSSSPTCPGSDPILPPGLEISRVSTPQGNEQFIQVLAHESVPSPEIQQRWLEFEIHLGFDEALPWQLYVGALDGEPAGTAAMFFGKRSAGL